MSDEIKNNENEASTAQPATELSEDTLEQVTGGADVSTPLPTTIYKGTHIPKTTIEL